MVVRLTWTDNNGPEFPEDGHRIYRTITPIDLLALPAPLADLPPDTVTWDDTAPLPSAYYTVSAYKGSVEKFSTEILVGSGVPVLAKRHWRIYVTDTNWTGSSGGDAVALVEVTWVDFNGVPVPKPGSVVVTEDSAFTSSFNGAKAYDNDLGTLWSGSGPAIPGWIAFDFGASDAFDMQQVTMTARTGTSAAQAPRDFDIQYSDDGITWQTHWSVAGIVWASGEQKTFNKP